MILHLTKNPKTELYSLSVGLINIPLNKRFQVLLLNIKAQTGSYEIDYGYDHTEGSDSPCLTLELYSEDFFISYEDILARSGWSGPPS